MKVTMTGSILMMLIILVKPSKVIINPDKIILFRWLWNQGGWKPTSHTVTPVVKAEHPITVRQIRGFLGAVKQISPCIKDYAIQLAPLEKIVAGKNLLETIMLTEELEAHFQRIKQVLTSIETYYIPNPEDTLHTYSDWSQSYGTVR